MPRSWRVVFWAGSDGERRKVSYPMTESAALTLYRDLAALAMRRRGVGGVAVINPAGDAVHSVKFS